MPTERRSSIRFKHTSFNVMLDVKPSLVDFASALSHLGDLKRPMPGEGVDSTPCLSFLLP